MMHRLNVRRNGFICAMALLAAVNASAITVSSVEELVIAAGNSNQEVTMTPGTYEMEDYLTPAVISATVPYDVMGSAMISFSGHNNTFDLTGVTIEVNTELLNDFGTKVMEFYVTGSSNVIKGLTVTDIGNEPTSSGGQSFVVDGTNNTIQNVTLNMSGSYPYGYGDLLGKGSGNLVSLKKHSGMLINGLDINILDCSIYSESFGHLFFIQGGRNVYFENCYAEAVTRTTDEMLAETSGPAFDVGFAAVYKNYDGEKVITPGYTKSLSECGFRTYGSGGAGGYTTGAQTFVNCRARDCRIGFALTKIDGDVLVRDCEAVGCESGYNITGVTIENSRGDVVNGPLLYINPGDLCTVDLALMPATNTTTVHAIACIPDYDHVVTLKKWADMTRGSVHSILVGSSRPAGSNPFSPLGTKTTSRITLNNYTEMPVVIGSTVSSSTITSNGDVTDNGSGNTVLSVRDMPSPVGHWTFDDASGSVAADSSGNGYDGAVTATEWVAGTDGGALDFDGTNSSVSIPAAAFSSISNEITISFWVYGGALQPQDDAAFYAENSAGNRVLNIHLPYSNGSVFWDAGYSSNYDRIYKAAEQLEYKGTWNHWVFTKDASAGTMKIYLNGALWHAGTGKTKSITGITEASIGAQLATKNYDGMMDDVRLYNVALSDYEVESLYGNTPAGVYSSMQDIGTPGLLGSASYSDGIYKVTAGGSGLIGTADQGYFLSRPLSGDGEIVTQVTSVNNTHTFAMAGLMIRETSDAGSKKVVVGVLPNRLATMSSRPTTDGATTLHNFGGGKAADKWIKLVRSGNQFSGYYSFDGSNWTLISSVTVSMAADVESGLVVSAGEDTALSMGTFNMVPPAPTNLTASAFDAAQIDLNWDAAASASAYNVRRATMSGGSYALVADGISSTNHYDTGLSAGTNYYYVVSGEYYGVEGAASVEAVAVPSAVINPDDVFMDFVQVATDDSGKHFSFMVPVSGLGHNYQVLYTESLVDADWQYASDVVAGNGAELLMKVALNEGQTNLFYKLEAWRQ